MQFNYGDVVNWEQDFGGHIKSGKGRICGKRKDQTEHFKEGYWMNYYLIEDLDSVGFEHDDYTWVLDKEIK